MATDSKLVRTMCPMNCHPTLCGMLAEVKDGQLLSVKGDKDNPDSQGFLCIRGQASREIIGNPQRLLHPLVRDSRNEDFRQATWEEALERMVGGMQNPEAVGIWAGHGVAANNYGTRIVPQLLSRFANFHGSTFWGPPMICWGLGAFGLAMTGMLETNTKEDMGEHADLIILWAANLTSQPNTARHLLAAKKRGAHIVTIDVRRTEVAAKSDDVFMIRPGTDTALALAMMNVIVTENLHDAEFVAKHTIGFDELAEHVQQYSPQWAASITGIEADRIIDLARRYARTRPAMIVLGGSSMHKGTNGWQAGRAIACLPGLTGNVGFPGAGFGPRHGGNAHGRGSGSIAGKRKKGQPITPNQMPAITQAFKDGRVETLLLLGSNMLSSFADANDLARGLDLTKLIVSYDLFLNDTARRFADVVLPATSWLEEVGCKATTTHLYLMEKALQPPGQTRTVYSIIKDLAERLDIHDFHPWSSQEAMIDAILDHPCTGHATVKKLREEGGIRPLRISHVANPTLEFDTPSRKIEFFSEQATKLGLPALPTFDEKSVSSPSYPLVLTQGRTMTQFHGFYNSGRALPTLAKRDPEPVLWLSHEDALPREIEDGAVIRMFNVRGEMKARAHVTDRIPSGTVWMRDGWAGLNTLTSGSGVLPDEAADHFEFPAGQSDFHTYINISAAG